MHFTESSCKTVSKSTTMVQSLLVNQVAKEHFWIIIFNVLLILYYRLEFIAGFCICFSSCLFSSSPFCIQSFCKHSELLVWLDWKVLRVCCVSACVIPTVEDCLMLDEDLCSELFYSCLSGKIFPYQWQWRICVGRVCFTILHLLWS